MTEQAEEKDLLKTIRKGCQRSTVALKINIPLGVTFKKSLATLIRGCYSEVGEAETVESTEQVE